MHIDPLVVAMIVRLFGVVEFSQVADFLYDVWGSEGISRSSFRRRVDRIVRELVGSPSGEIGTVSLESRGCAETPYSVLWDEAEGHPAMSTVFRDVAKALRSNWQRATGTREFHFCMRSEVKPFFASLHAQDRSEPLTSRVLLAEQNFEKLRQAYADIVRTMPRHAEPASSTTGGDAGSLFEDPSHRLREAIKHLTNRLVVVDTSRSPFLEKTSAASLESHVAGKTLHWFPVGVRWLSGGDLESQLQAVASFCLDKGIGLRMYSPKFANRFWPTYADKEESHAG